jgi:hypothetical protein
MLAPLVWFSALSFFGYGAFCLTSSYMVAEFERYGMPEFRVLTGASQILAAAALLAGFAVPQLGALAAAALSIQMFVGLGVRVSIGDSFAQSFPAAIYFLANAAIAYLFFAKR